MPINVRRRGWVPIVEVSGDDLVRERIEDLLDQGESVMIVDLTPKSILDSLILGQLVACREHARRHDAVIKLLVTPRQHDVVLITRLDQLFDVYCDEDEALDSFVSWDMTAGIP